MNYSFQKNIVIYEIKKLDSAWLVNQTENYAENNECIFESCSDTLVEPEYTFTLRDSTQVNGKFIINFQNVDESKVYNKLCTLYTKYGYLHRNIKVIFSRPIELIIEEDISKSDEYDIIENVFWYYKRVYPSFYKESSSVSRRVNAPNFDRNKMYDFIKTHCEVTNTQDIIRQLEEINTSLKRILERKDISSSKKALRKCKVNNFYLFYDYKYSGSRSPKRQNNKKKFNF